MTCEQWPIIWPCDVDTYTPEQVFAATEAAQQILWAATGRRLGRCEIVESYDTVRTSGCGQPYLDDRLVWHNNGGISSCCAIELAQQPVISVLEVWERGVLLPASAYRLDGYTLMRVGGCWPVGDDCDAPAVRVRYAAGVPLRGPEYGPEPEGGGVAPLVRRPDPLWSPAALAMGEVAHDILLALCGGECRLPSRVASVTRQGVTMTFERDPGKLGLPLADALIDVANPNRLQQRSRVYSPDLPRRR